MRDEAGERMDEREKLIQALACSTYSGVCPPECPCEFRFLAYKAETTCEAVVAYKVMQILKGMRPVKPKEIVRRRSFPRLVYRCGNCEEVINTTAKYCWNCGKEVDWGWPAETKS